MMHAFSMPYQRSVLYVSLWALLVGCLFLGPRGHAGEMYRWIDEQGHIHLTDIPPSSRSDLQDLKVYRQSDTSPPSKPSDTPAVEASGTKRSSTPPGGVMVDAVLNRRLTVPLTLDTGAELTVLTKQAAEELGIPSLDQLPIRQFGTAGGMVNGPITSLRSLRVGTAEARDVIVGIDMDGRMPVGLLGKSFLRHFKVTVDQQRGQATFERSRQGPAHLKEEPPL
jgi:clan AA aspartic protease (TIGR02281 family)